MFAIAPTTTGTNFRALDTIVVGSIATLKTLTGMRDKQQVSVASYYESATPDGGGGIFVWDSTSSATANDGTIIAPDAGGVGRWRLIETGKRIVSTRDNGIAAVAYGDSITNGINASAFETTSFRALIASTKFWTVTNSGVNGAQIASMVDQKIYQRTVALGDNYVALLGFNDMRYNAVVAENLNRFGGAVRGAIAWLGLPEANKVRGVNASFTGTWATQASNGGNLSKGTSLSGTATFTVIGSTVLVGYTRTLSATGTLQVSIDGVNVGTLSNATTYQANAQTYIADLEVFRNLTNKEHTVVITAAGTSAIIDWVAGTGPDSLAWNAPQITIGNCLRMKNYAAGGAPFNVGSDASVLRHNELIRQAVEEMQGLGVQVAHADVSAALAPEVSGVIDVDDIHPNDSGHAIIARVMLAAMDSAPKPKDRQFAGATKIQLARARAEKNLQGGGTISWSSDVFGWSAAFKVIPAGYGYHWSTSGYFDITQPTSGNAIGYGGHADTAFSASGITLGSFDALFYIPPVGHANTSVAGNFAIVDWSGHFEIPGDWIFLAGRDGTNSGVNVGNGLLLAPSTSWQAFIGAKGLTLTAPTLLNSWVNFGAGYAVAGYYKNTLGEVCLEGLIKSGTPPSVAFTLPAGFRPTVTIFFAVPSNNAFGSVSVAPNGSVTVEAGSGTWLDLSSIRFRL